MARDITSELAALDAKVTTPPTPTPTPNGTGITAAQLAELEQLRAENARLKASAKTAGFVTVKVAPKGGVSFRAIPGASVQYGLTLYPSTLLWLLDHSDDLRKFVADHKAELSWGKNS